MALELKNVPSAATKSYEPKKTVELKSPAGAVVSQTATGRGRAIPAVRDIDTKNQVNQKKRESERESLKSGFKPSKPKATMYPYNLYLDTKKEFLQYPYLPYPTRTKKNSKEE